MTLEDFSNGMDTLLNSYSRSGSFGEDTSKDNLRLDEFEKSQFLTKAQEDIVLSLYNGKNTFDESFEYTEEIRRYLAGLIRERSLSPITTTNGMPLGVDSRSRFFTLPDDLWFITYESAAIEGGKCENDNIQTVVPVRQDEYQRLRKNPFRGINDRRALRLDLSDNNVEIVSKYTVTQYYVRYLCRLTPILLVNLSDGLEFQGYTTPQECMVHEGLHEKILERAVVLALQSRGYAQNNNENR